MKKVYFIDVADCLRRKIDGQRVKQYLVLNGHILVEKPSDSDYICINTCGVTNDKVKEAIRTILRFSIYDCRIIVLGCVVTTDPDVLSANTINIPINGMSLLDKYFYKQIPYEKVPVPEQSNDGENLFYFPICRGCTEACSYCATRKAIGNITSVPLDECLNIFNNILLEKPDKIVFDGDNIGAYGKDIGSSLGQLLDVLPDIEKKYLLNIDMLHPVYFLENFEAISRQVEKHHIGFLLIPFQAGSNRILKLMNRRGNLSNVLEKLIQVREIDSGVILGTHIIIGFPSETFREFEETVEILKSSRLDWIRVFCFSSRNHTKAASLDGHLNENEMENRLNFIIQEMKKNGYFSKRNPSGATFCRKQLIIENPYTENPYRLSCYREVIDL